VFGTLRDVAAAQLVDELSETLRRLEFYRDPAMLEEVAGDPELVEELHQIRQHTVDLDNTVRDKLGA